jgi:hypothetical protein
MKTIMNITLSLIISTASLGIASFCSAQVDLGELSANPYAPDSTANPKSSQCIMCFLWPLSFCHPPEQPKA